MYMYVFKTIWCINLWNQPYVNKFKFKVLKKRTFIWSKGMLKWIVNGDKFFVFERRYNWTSTRGDRIYMSYQLLQFTKLQKAPIESESDKTERHALDNA